MPGELEQLSQQVGAMREFFINEAFDAAEQVQQRAENIQAYSQSVPPRAPIEGAAPIHDAGMANKLFWIGLGALGALGVAYYLISRGE